MRSEANIRLIFIHGFLLLTVGYPYVSPLDAGFRQNIRESLLLPRISSHSYTMQEIPAKKAAPVTTNVLAHPHPNNLSQPGSMCTEQPKTSHRKQF